MTHASPSSPTLPRHKGVHARLRRAMRGGSTPCSPQAPETVTLGLSFLGLALALFTRWLGGELVDRMAVGVDEGAHVNAPSSLTRRRVA